MSERWGGSWGLMGVCHYGDKDKNVPPMKINDERVPSVPLPLLCRISGIWTWLGNILLPLSVISVIHPSVLQRRHVTDTQGKTGSLCINMDCWDSFFAPVTVRLDMCVCRYQQSFISPLTHSLKKYCEENHSSVLQVHWNKQLEMTDFI